MRDQNRIGQSILASRLESPTGLAYTDTQHAPTLG